jgi:peptide-methionine (R)-S-oxide reductase
VKEKILKSEDEWKQVLSEDEFRVCRKKGTERPFSGEYYDLKDKGMYQCRCCGAPLFSSTAKYDSGSGWPSFYRPASDDGIVEKQDNSHGMTRTEILCSRCEAHLGHVFPDGPQPTGLRYCVNSLSLSFEKDNDAE